jgi:hypothetical protein
MEGGWSEGDDDEHEDTEADAELSRADDWYDEHGRDFRGC